MTFPTKDELKVRIMSALDSDSMEGRSLEEIANYMVESFYDFMKDQIKTPVSPVVGLAFKHPALTGIFHVAYMDDEYVWIVNANTRYGGLLAAEDTGWWSYGEESRDVRKDKSKPRPGAGGQNPAYKAGEKYSRSQRAHMYEVVATADKCVLLRNVRSGLLQPEPNDSMEKYYRKETNIKEIRW